MGLSDDSTSELTNIDTNLLDASNAFRNGSRESESLEGQIPVRVEHTSNEARITKIQGIFQRDGSNASQNSSTSSSSSDDEMKSNSNYRQLEIEQENIAE